MTTGIHFVFVGITNFDLIGNFGSMEWLGNFWIIIICNSVFAVCTALSLITKFTAAVRREIYNRLESVFHRDHPASSVRDHDALHTMSFNNSSANLSVNGNGVHIKED